MGHGTGLLWRDFYCIDDGSLGSFGVFADSLWSINCLESMVSGSL